MGVTARYVRSIMQMVLKFPAVAKNPMAGHSGELRRGGTTVAPQLRDSFHNSAPLPSTHTGDPARL